MAIFYYDALPKDWELDVERNASLSRAIMHRTREMLAPFYQYLSTAIQAMEDKTEIKARWQPVKEEGLVRLKPLDQLFRVEKRTAIRVENQEVGIYRIIGEYEVDWDEPIKYRADGQKGEFILESSQLLDSGLIRLGNAPLKFEQVIWGFFSIQLEPAWTVLKVGDEVETSQGKHKIVAKQGATITIRGVISDDDRLTFQGKPLSYSIVRNATPPAEAPVILEKEIEWICKGKRGKHDEKVPIDSYLAAHSLVWEHDGGPFQAEKADEGYLVFQGKDLEKEVGKTVRNEYGLRFSLTSADKDSHIRFFIQLLEIDEDNREDLPGASPLRFFFDDDIEVEDNQGGQYRILRGIESERKLLLGLKSDQKGRPKPCFPKGEILSVRINTYQLRRQQDSVRALRDKPVAGHEKLIKLFEDREKVRWPRPESLTSELAWHILTDAQREGADKQREFVEKALQTPDFAILEGPPGSGKTTVILELICQLVKRGQRVLLCGSTHVAIDNVLERLKEKDLLAQLSILPVRIGDQNRISRSVEEFQLDNLKEQAGIAESLLLEASNLVCGTTIGILQHPHMKQADVDRQEKQKMPVSPQFDYLIIDESSKTTFQEFLVPALYARRWILVGDVKQLSPFTDRDQLVSNISRMPLKSGKSLPESLQAACLKLYKLREIGKGQPQHLKVILLMEQQEMVALYRELSCLGAVKEFRKLLFGFLTHHPQQLQPAPKVEKAAAVPQTLVIHPQKDPWVSVFAPDVLLVELTVFQAYESQLPADATVINYASWETSTHAFRTSQFAAAVRHRPRARERRKDLEGHAEIAAEFLAFFEENSWADQVAWRIDREHQLRMKGEKSTRRLTEGIEDLLPQSLGKEADVANRLDTIASVALPSILEMLDRGLSKRKTQHESTLTRGFDRYEKADRHVLLAYQQRMHPDISKFPREQFYEQKALQDMTGMAGKRAWNFDRYAKRTWWVDVNGKTVKNYNHQEVNRMVQELMAFLKWASQERPPDDGRDAKEEWSVACLTFYRGQEAKLREKLREELKPYGSHNETAFSSFSYRQPGGYQISIKLHTVDKFQGQEADMVYLSMVQTSRDGFMDSPNRLNVAITRARYQLVIIGNHAYFSEKSRSEDLRKLARSHQRSLTQKP